MESNSIVIDGVEINISEPYIKNIIRDIFTNKKNVLITGEGGTGKSVLIKLISLICNKKNIKHSVCSTTGASAVDINGNTIHSFACVGTGDKEPLNYYSSMRKEKRNIIQKTKLIIIDEISMMGSSLFDKIDELFELVRYENTDIHLYKSMLKKLTIRPELHGDENSESESIDIRVPFGGMQLVLVGDFLQLPPINDNYIFKSKAWKQLNLVHHKLNNTYRFSNNEWKNLLKRVRLGDQTDEDIQFLKNRVVNKEQINSLMQQKITPTILFPKRKDVDYLNQLSLDKIDNKLYKFIANDIFDDNLFIKNGKKMSDMDKLSKMKSIKDILQKVVKEELLLKVGSQVMYLKNNRNLKLVNGSRGVVTNISNLGIEVLFMDGDTRTIGLSNFEIKYDNKDIIRKQVPLTLAYAFSIHKIQGKTLDSAILDLGSSVFADFQAYVGLSRVKDGNNLYLLDFNEKSINVNYKVVKKYG